MRNIGDNNPFKPLHGRCLYNTLFVDDSDIKDKQILDIGCGFGWQELNFIKRGAKNIIGVEIAENNLEIAKKNIVNTKVIFKIGSAIELPFENESFDTVVSWDVIEHIPKDTEWKMFKEVKRVLKNNGVFYLSTPNRSFLGNIFDPAWWLIGHRHYSENKLINLTKESSLKAESIVIKGGFWEILGIINLYVSKWIFRRKPFFEEYINNQMDSEYKKEKGFTSIFIKLRKM